MSQHTTLPDSPANNASPVTPANTIPAVVPSRSKRNVMLGSVVLILFFLLGYQQVQIGRLFNELTALRSDAQSGETRGHLQALDARLQEMNTRLTYLDSKIASADQKAQAALDKIRINEEKADWLGNILKTIGWK